MIEEAVENVKDLFGDIEKKVGKKGVYVILAILAAVAVYILAVKKNGGGGSDDYVTPVGVTTYPDIVDGANNEVLAGAAYDAVYGAILDALGGESFSAPNPTFKVEYDKVPTTLGVTVTGVPIVDVKTTAKEDLPDFFVDNSGNFTGVAPSVATEGAMLVEMMKNPSSYSNEQISAMNNAVISGNVAYAYGESGVATLSKENQALDVYSAAFKNSSVDKAQLQADLVAAAKSGYNNDFVQKYSNLPTSTSSGSAYVAKPTTASSIGSPTYSSSSSSSSSSTKPSSSTSVKPSNVSQPKPITTDERVSPRLTTQPTMSKPSNVSDPKPKTTSSSKSSSTTTKKTTTTKKSSSSSNSKSSSSSSSKSSSSSSKKKK